MSNILFSKTHQKALLTIEDFVNLKYGLKPGQMYESNRRQGIAHARFTAYYILNKVYGLNLPQIADIFKKDHTTVMHGIQVIDDRGWSAEILRQYKEVFPSIHTPNSNNRENI